VTFRPEFQPPWTGQPQVTMLALNRLDWHDRTALVDQIVGGKTLPNISELRSFTKILSGFRQETQLLAHREGALAPAHGHMRVQDPSDELIRIERVCKQAAETLLRAARVVGLPGRQKRARASARMSKNAVPTVSR
jgi:hypothetical protein